MIGWILQRTSELDAGYHALNSSGFSSRFNRAPVYRRLSEIPPSELDEILHGCYRLNSTQFHQRDRQSDALRGGGSGYKFAVWRTARSPESNVDVEPPSSMDDSSMILIEIGVGVDEGPRLNMTIGGRTQSSVKPR